MACAFYVKRVNDYSCTHIPTIQNSPPRHKATIFLGNDHTGHSVFSAGQRIQKQPPLISEMGRRSDRQFHFRFEGADGSFARIVAARVLYKVTGPGAPERPFINNIEGGLSTSFFKFEYGFNYLYRERQLAPNVKDCRLTGEPKPT